MFYVFFSLFFFVKQKTAYEVRISDWSSDVCSSDLPERRRRVVRKAETLFRRGQRTVELPVAILVMIDRDSIMARRHPEARRGARCDRCRPHAPGLAALGEEAALVVVVEREGDFAGRAAPALGSAGQLYLARAGPPVPPLRPEQRWVGKKV